MIGIYKIENTVNGKVYIGQSIHIELRWAEHKSELRGGYHENSHLQLAWNKYGEVSFKFSVLEFCDKSDLNDREIYWINYYKSFYGQNGYNIESGGSIDKQIYNPVLRFDLSGNYIDEWFNAYEASRNLNINVNTIYGCINKKFKCAGNYIFINKNKYIIDNDLSFWLTNRVHRNVCQFDLQGNLLNTFNTKHDAEKYINGSISGSLYNLCYTSHGFIWKYYDEINQINEDYLYKANNSMILSNSLPFYQLDKFGNVIKKYICLREAVQDGYNERLINECLRGLRNTYKKYLWVYETQLQLYDEEYCMQKYNTPELKIKGRIEQLDINTQKIIKIYQCLEHVKYDGFLPTNVADCCKGRKKQYKGFLWRCETLV